ncbi:molybdate ABC transporter permease subunit [Phyllobacterium phragmitis]|uniref:Molybdenum transport system permease n=1 Tax=Phyllobacterium phragmitis TaxID=2670329 RepID=A0A2S9IQB4_9HYPH|nr:molybdate ABC transporter permease subunit [Phyllobacterium phragmitis]PRD42710.1 molybdate ABC transporter permease subunit [Phyllobacterium phragmitis]
MFGLTEADWGIILLSLRIAFVAILFALPLAFAVAWVLARYSFPGKSLLQAMVTMPLVLPPVVTGYLLLLWFGTRGALGAPFSEWFGIGFAFRWTGAALAAGVMAFPLLVRPMRLSIENIDRGLEEAARTLGAGRIVAFFTVTLPMLLPGVIAGAMLGFAKALGEFGATITFVSNIPGETQTLSLAIYSFLQTPAGDSAAIKLILVSVFLSVVAVILSEWLQRRLDSGRSG